MNVTALVARLLLQYILQKTIAAKRRPNQFCSDLVR